MKKHHRHTSLRKANAARQREWKGHSPFSLLYYSNQLGGECGEAQNVVKKIERERLGAKGSRATLADLADELADVVISAELTASAAGINLDKAVRNKFNATSKEHGFKTRLGAR